MFRWIRELLKQFSLRKKEVQIQQDEKGVIQPETPVEHGEISFSHKQEQSLESTNYDAIIEDVLEESTKETSELDYSRVISSIIKEYSDSNTSDELSAIDRLVDTLRPSEYSAQEQLEVGIPPVSKSATDFDVKEAKSIDTHPVLEKQIEAKPGPQIIEDLFSKPVLKNSEKEAVVFADASQEKDRNIEPEPIIDNVPTTINDGQEVIWNEEASITETINDKQADNIEITEVIGSYTEDNYQGKEEQTNITEPEDYTLSENIVRNENAVSKPCCELQEPDVAEENDTLLEATQNSDPEIIIEIEEPDTSDISQKVISEEDTDTTTHEESSKGSEDIIYEPKDSVQIIEDNLNINEHAAEPSNTIRINVDEISTGYEELNLDTQDIDHLMESLCFKIRSNKLIGYDLLQIISDEDIVHKIHENAEHYLLENYNRSSVNVYTHKEDIIVSLVLIALLHYDGSLWDHVRNQYSNLYYVKSEQKTDRMIRQILAEYITEDTRYINFVIRQAIIPYNYLYDFITFAFDIYKGTLQYEIPEKLDYILANIYIDVSSMYESDSEQFQTNVKTYKLIKTTKDIIDNVQWFGELIAYTNLVLQYIDLHYWEDNRRALPYHEYFNPVVEKWIDNNKSLFYDERDYKSRERSSWSATFSIDQTDIILHIANCIIRKENDPSNISINVVNDGFSYTVLKPKVTEEIGGYLVHGTDIKVANPLGELEYQIMCGNKVLYSTAGKLYREYLLFNENHSEIKNTSTYYGNIDIVTYKKNSTDLDVFYTDPKYDYVIAQKYVEPFDSIRIGETELFFYAEEKTILNGDKVPGVRINSKHHSFEMYRSINYLSLISSDPPEELAFQVNRNNYHWGDWLVRHSSNGYLYKIDLTDYLTRGFNELNIVNWKNDNQIIFTDRFFYDPSFSVSFQPDIERKIRMNINCNLFPEDSVISDMDAENVFDIAFVHPVFSNTLHMIVTPGIPVYRIDNKPWHLFDEYISAKSITSLYSRIYFDGITPDAVKVLSKDPERILNEVLIQNVAGKSFLTIEKLLSVPSSVAVASLAFYKDGIAKETIDIFYRAIIDRNSLETDYDSETNEGIIRFNVLGNDQIHVTVFSEDELYYRNEDEIMPAEIRIPNIDSFKKYNISITGGRADLFELNSSKQYEILSQTISFYNVTGILKRSFTIHSCRLHYTKMNSDEGMDYIVHPHQSEIEVLRKVNSDIFEVSVNQIKGGTKKSFVAEMEMTSNIMSGDFWCMLKYKDEWLKYDAAASSPTNVTSNNNYMDILEYHVYYKSTENLKKKMLDALEPESNDKSIIAVLPYQGKYFNKGVSDQEKGKPTLINISLSAHTIMPKKQEALKGDILILHVEDKYYQCRLAGEKFKIDWQLSNGIPRLKIDAKRVYDFIQIDSISGLSIENLRQKYNVLYKGNIPGKKNEIGYVYAIKDA